VLKGRNGMKNVSGDTKQDVRLKVQFHETFDSVLPQIQTFSSCNEYPVFLSRDRWAKELGVTAKTIQRWEKDIVSKLFLLGYKTPERSNLLDQYQRFVLSLIRVMRARKMSSGQILVFMTTPRGNPRWQKITRQKFNQVKTEEKQ
jgi:hypothetical protein